MVTAYAASVSYVDALSTANLPANLIQAQRDFFGAHTVERVGQKGAVHVDWQGEVRVIT